MEKLKIVDMNKLTFVISDNILCCMNKKNKILAQENIEDCILYYYKTEYGLGKCCLAGFYFPQSDKHITMQVKGKDKEIFNEFINQIIADIKFADIKQRDAIKLSMNSEVKKVQVATQEIKDSWKEFRITWNDLKMEISTVVHSIKSVLQSPQKRIAGSVENELSKIDAMSLEGWKFEEYIAELLRRRGYKTTVTARSGDYGVDVIAVGPDKVRYAIQCKCYSNKLGNSPIQEVVAGMKKYDCQVGVVATNNYFTENAKELARVNGVKLWDRNTLKQMIAGNI